MNQKLFFNRIKGYREEIQVAIFHELEELFLSSFQRLEETPTLWSNSLKNSTSCINLNCQKEYFQLFFYSV